MRVVITKSPIIWLILALQFFGILCALGLLIFFGISSVSVTLFVAIIVSIWVSLSHLKLMKLFRESILNRDKQNNADMAER